MNLDFVAPLEFDQVRVRLAAHTAFRASEALALALEPSTDAAEIKKRQQETSEARALLDLQPGLGIGGARDVRPLTQTARRGGTLTPSEFLELRATLLSARNLRRALVRQGRDGSATRLPRLASLAENLNDVPQLVDAIERALNDQGEIRDDASPELARLRRELNVARARVMERLQHLITAPQSSKYLQEPIITQREGRYVIPVRAEARGRIDGIVHDVSASGATLFIEPIAVVELGNRVRELQIREQREIERILRELTARVAAHADAIDGTVETLAQLDLAFAKAKYSAQLKAVEPILSAPAPDASPILQLKQARHPLLDPKTVVPISLELGSRFSILIITGPNTGGKTVTLKTVGLLALMAQSGLHIPADADSRLPVYDGIFADIGDEQSIAQNLSTFSAHLKNIIRILQCANSRSLVLLDELGAGTDPVEGAALARAIVETLLERKIPTLIATHYAELKAFAHVTPGIENACMEFDVETLAPTFQLTIGLPGRSNAFAIATRLGLERAIVERAHSHVGRSNVELETLLAQLKEARQEIAREQARAVAAREAAERAAQQARREYAEMERQRAEILRQAREQALGELRAIRAELNRLKRQWREQEPDREGLQRSEQVLRELEERAEALRSPASQAPQPTPLSVGELIEIGDQVYVPQLNRYGEIVDLKGDQVAVQMGALRMNLDASQVVLHAKAKSRAPSADRTTIILPEAESPGTEVHLRGMRAEEALLKLETHLDRAYLAGLPYVRVVHGKGTGTLRRLVREFLATSPLVRSFQTAEPNEGGEGVTIVELTGH